MDDSPKARELADAVARIIDKKYKRYAQTVAERLSEEFSPLKVTAAGEPTRWEEFKAQVRQKSSYSRDVIEHLVKKWCSKLLKELPEEERSLLALSETAYKAKPDPLILELYDWVQDLARNEAEREAWLATTPSELKEPVSITSDEIVIPLADFLVTSDLVSDVNKNLDKRMFYQSLPEAEDHEQMEKAVRILLDNNSDLIMPEELEYAVNLPRNERGEYLFDRLITNTSTGWRDSGVF
jgi:hypothetical protein